MSVPPVTAEPPTAFRRLEHFDGARDSADPQERLRRIRRQAAAFREEMLSEPPVASYRSFDLIRVPYPTRYALRDACPLPVPFIHIINRMFLIRFRSEGGIRTLLVSPSDVEANKETPYFKRLSSRFSFLGPGLDRILAPRLGTVEGCLARAGVKPDAVDYITYDHLHTQDLRRWLGTAERPAYFPNAKLLIMRQEWESVHGLLPPQASWYCPGGTDGIPAEKVVRLDHDVALGPGVALMRTSGHTEGNHSIVARTPEGLMVTSENGVGPDAYAPARSAIPGLRRYARETGMEVVLNGNTLERGLDQYLSMIQEREMAGPSQRNPDFPNVVASSELASYWLFPGIHPTFSFGALEFGRT